MFGANFLPYFSSTNRFHRERCFSSFRERETKKKCWVRMKNRTSDLLIPRSDALPLSHRDSTVSEVYYEVHITHVLHTARISNVDSVMFVDWMREMVSFEPVWKVLMRLILVILPLRNLQINLFFSEQLTSLQPPALASELLATTHVFWPYGASGCFAAQFV